MSVDRDSVKGEETKVEDVKKEELAADSKNGADDKSSDDASEKGKKVPPKKRVPKAKEVKKEVKKEESKKRDKKHINDDGGEGDDEDEAGDEIHPESGALKGSGVVPLLDQPLELQGTRDRKKVERFTQEVKLDSTAGAVIEIPEGRGDALGDIPIINAAIQRARVEILKSLHKVLFTKVGKINFIKNNIKKFNGFDFDTGSDQFEKKKVFISKLQVREIRSIMDVLDLEKKGNREELSKRMAEFLVCPKDSGKEAPKLRSKRSSAIKAAKRGFSESEEEEERRAPRARRPKAKISMKEDSGSESEEKITKTPSNRRGKKEVVAQEEDKISEEENEKLENESEDIDSDEPKSKKKAKSTPNSKKSPSIKNTPAKKGGGNKKAEKKSSAKKRKSDEKSGQQSSSEDEPLSKKSKTPPTDEEIKSYVKEILEGANLEEITMKTVCKQVYANYPDFDLAHKKDFIKTTVKSLIST